MGAFEYKALDQRGKENKGVLEGDTARTVRQQLREKGLTPLQIQEVAVKERKAASGGNNLLQRGISTADLALITRQLATLVRAALPLEEALKAAAEQCEKARLKSMLLGVRSRVMEGHTLAMGMGDFPHIFPDLFRATVAAGEQSGHLDVVLERLAEYTEHSQRQRQKVMVALLYPTILGLVSIAIVVAMLTMVVPKIAQSFANLDAELPLITQIVITASDFLRDHGLILGVIVAGCLLVAQQIFKREGPKRRLHKALLKMALIGRVIRGTNTGRFAHTLSILVSSGVPVLESLRISSEVIANLPMREAVTEAAQRVGEGTSINSALGHTKLFPPIMIHLIASGESSGQLEEMLDRAAENQDNETQTLVETFVGAFEPLLILFAGGLVFALVAAVMLPIFELNTLIK